LREQQEEGDAAVEAKAVDKVADYAESAVVEEKLEPEEDKAEEVGSGTGDGGELGDEEVDFSVESMEMTKQEDKVAPVAEANGELDDKKVASDGVVSGEEAPEESTNKGADVEEEAAKPEPASEASPVILTDGSEEEPASASAGSVVEDSPEKGQNAEDQAAASEAPKESTNKGADVDDNDESAKPEPASEASPVVVNAVSEDEPAPASANSVVEDSPEKWQNAEDQAAASEALKESTNMDSDLEYEDAEPQLDNEASPVVVNDGSAEEPAPASANSVVQDSPEKEQNAEDQAAASEAVEDVGAKKLTEVENGAAAPELVPESSNDNNGADETTGATEVADHEEEAGERDIVVAEAVADDEDGVGNEADEDEDGVNSDTSPARVAILESSEAAKQIMKELAEGSSSGSVSG